MPTYPFLSDEWIAAARELRAKHPDASPSVALKMNLVVSEVPFGAGRLDAHVDTSGGELDLELGHLNEADVVVSLDYDTARAVLVDGNGEVAMAAFMAGKVRVEGDLTKLLAYQAEAPGTAERALQGELRSITAT